MISRTAYTADHLGSIRAQFGGDPELIERTVFAFGLLEALVRVGLSFTFKGGTSLMLLLKEPKRLSTDIDIIVPPGTDVDAALEAASHLFPFKRREEQIRKGKNGIVKRHFRFTYDSPGRQREFYILLDILFESAHYARYIDVPIDLNLLPQEGTPISVKAPSVDCVLGDKLTAFAPHTIGIPFGVDKELEICKQFFDVAFLLDACTDFELVRKTYQAIAPTERAYRGLDTLTDKDTLLDTYETARCIGARGKVAPGEYQRLLRGLRDLRNHVFGFRLSTEIAQLWAPKVMYAALCLMKGVPFMQHETKDWSFSTDLTHEELFPLRYIRKNSAQDYTYLKKVDLLL